MGELAVSSLPQRDTFVGSLLPNTVGEKRSPREMKPTALHSMDRQDRNPGPNRSNG